MTMSQQHTGTPRSHKSFAHRMKSRRVELGLHKQELASQVGVSLTTIQQYENGQLPKGEFAVRLGGALKCSLDWLLAGKGEMSGELLDSEGGRLVTVPIAEPRLMERAGGLELSAGTVRPYSFRRDFLQQKGNPDRMVLLRISGDSMQPQIMPNDMVLIDQSQCEPVPGRIYAVAVEEMVYLKMVNAVPGKIILSSINPAYGPIEVEASGELGNLVRIIGRAVWTGRELG